MDSKPLLLSHYTISKKYSFLIYRIICSTRKEKEDDYHFEKLIKKYSFVTYKYLDIDESIINPIYLELAINQLAMINQYKTPKEKINILINFCNILTSMITASSHSHKNKSKSAGADEVFPLVVYAILKGNIKKLKSNLSFIQLFRHETRLDSKEEYYYTTISSAVDFIENLTYDKISLKESDFESLCNKSDKLEYEKMKTPLLVTKRNNDENYLLYQLTNGNKDLEGTNYIELSDLKQNVSINTESVISKSHIYQNSSLVKNFGLLYIDLDKLYKEYFSCEFKEFSIFKIEKMYNDFRIVLRLIELFKAGYSKNKLISIGFQNNSPKSIAKKSVHDIKEKEDNELNNKLIDI